MLVQLVLFNKNLKCTSFWLGTAHFYQLPKTKRAII